MSYLTNVAFTDAQFQAVADALGVIETQLPGLMALTAEQRKSMKYMREKSERFCRQALHIVGENPQIVPPNVPAAQAIANLKMLDGLRPLMVRMSELIERMTDTDDALGNDIMRTSLQAYGLLKLTGKSEGLASQCKELGVLFAKTPRQPEVAAA